MDDQMDLGIEAEEHVCQSCGMPVSGEDFAGGSEKGDYCSFCMTHGELTASKEDVRRKIAERIVADKSVSMEDALEQADQQMTVLQRWR